VTGRAYTLGDLRERTAGLDDRTPILVELDDRGDIDVDDIDVTSDHDGLFLRIRPLQTWPVAGARP
jgi:hypothetical protein